MPQANAIKAIVAMSENRVIGNRGAIPWHLPEDFKWFKRSTMGGILVMGRKTYESIGRPLPGRETIVFSRQERAISGVRLLADLRELEQINTEKMIWITGGSEIFRQTLHLCSEILLTRVHRTVPGDTFFPSFEDGFEQSEIILKTSAFTIERWIRRSTEG